MDEILLIDDNIDFLNVYSKILRKNGYKVTSISNPEIALSMFKKKSFSLAIIDMVMPKINGLEMLKKVKKISFETDIIILTGEGSIDTAVNAMKNGAYTYLTKPINIERLLLEVKNCLNTRKLSDENNYLREQINSDQQSFLGQSDVMKKIQRKIMIVAPTESTVLITGESGTGKELIANLIHKYSNRHNNPMIKVNCSALASGILESELFGHEKGSFTGADNMRKGRFELADKGSLFLDEIGEISMHIQTKLLRVIQEKRFQRVGGSKTITSNFRLITATNKELNKEIKEGRFREDLYYRLNVIPIYLPPLRDRREDIEGLLIYYLKLYNKKLKKNIKGFTLNAKSLLKNYNWPGNIRELKNVMERLVVFNEKELIDTTYLPQEIISNNKKYITINTLNAAKDNFEKNFLIKALEKNSGNITYTAKQINISRKTLHKKINKYNIKK